MWACCPAGGGKGFPVSLISFVYLFVCTCTTTSRSLPRAALEYFLFWAVERVTFASSFREEKRLPGLAEGGEGGREVARGRELFTEWTESDTIDLSSILSGFTDEELNNNNNTNNKKKSSFVLQIWLRMILVPCINNFFPFLCFIMVRAMVSRTQASQGVVLLYTIVALLVLVRPVEGLSDEALESFASLLSRAEAVREMQEFAPDPSVALSPYTPWREWFNLKPWEKQRLFVRLGIPLAIDITDSWAVESVVDSVLLMRPPGLCVARPAMSPQELFFLFFPDGREHWYGVQRIEELRLYLEVPSVWEKAMKGKFRSDLAEVQEAELDIVERSAKEAAAPGDLPVTLRFLVLHKVPFADLSIQWEQEKRVEGHRTTITRRPLLNLNVMLAARRSAERLRLQHKYRYSAAVDRLSGFLQAAEKTSLQAFLKAVAQHEHRVDQRASRQLVFEALQKSRDQRRALELKRQRQHSDEAVRQRTERMAARERAHREATCYQLERVAETLRADTAPNTTLDQRYQLLYAIAAKNNCTLQGAEASPTNGSTNNTGKQELVSVCEHVANFQLWSRVSGLPHTVAQSLVYLVLHYAAERSSPPFDAADFLAFVSRVVRRGEPGLGGAGCATPLPQQAWGELWYLLSSMELLQPSETSAMNRQLGVLHLYQAVWYGSRHAAGTLATMREHGMFVPQHEKVAARLLHYSMLDSANDVILQLLSKYGSNSTWLEADLHSPASVSTGAPEESNGEVPQMIISHWSSHPDPIPLDRLLRYERFFGWAGDGWNPVDRPYNNHASITQFLALEAEGETEEEVDEDAKDMMRRDENLLLKATLWLSGLYGVPRDTSSAECHLLIILRRHGFVCDMQAKAYGMRIERDWASMCPSHAHAMRISGPTIPCAWYGKPRPLPAALDEHVYKTLQQALLKLSFMYWVEQRFELSAYYAMLRVELSSTVYSAAAKSARSRGRKTQRMAPAWYERRLMPGKEQKQRIPPYAASAFATAKPLGLLALSRIMAPTAQARRKLDRILRETLYSGFDIRDEDGSRDTPLVRVFMSLIASSAESRSREAGNFFDHNPNSIHEVDSIFAVVWLIRNLHTLGSSVSPQVLLDRSFLYKNLLGDRGIAYLPLPSDNWVSYACRLSSSATRIHEFAARSLAQQLGLPCRPSTRSDQREPATAHLLDRIPATHTLQDLRVEKQYNIRSSKTTPLLYASDLNQYLGRIGMTKLSDALDRLLNAFYYLVGETTSESLLAQFGESILPSGNSPGRSAESDTVEEVEEQESGALTAVTSRSLFLEAFRTSEGVRDYSIAVLLLTNAFEFGMPQGFSLIFFSADKGNRYLEPLSTFLSREMWGGQLLAMWREEHYMAQWHREKPAILHRSRRMGPSLDHHTPFQHVEQEVRQELMGRMSRWAARTMRKGGDASWPPLAPHSFVAPRGEERERNVTVEESVKQQLLLCAGYLTYLQHLERYAGEPRQNHQLSQEFNQHSPYAGSLLPAADLACLGDLLKEDLVHLNPSERDRLTADLHDAAERSRYYYKLSRDRVEDASLPPSWFKFCDTPAEAVPQAHGVDTEPYFLVEPWGNPDSEVWSYLSLGEGHFFNSRLHRITGAFWAANFLSLRNRVWSFFGFRLSPSSLLTFQSIFSVMPSDSKCGGSCPMSGACNLAKKASESIKKADPKCLVCASAVVAVVCGAAFYAVQKMKTYDKPIEKKKIFHFSVSFLRWACTARASSPPLLMIFLFYVYNSRSACMRSGHLPSALGLLRLGLLLCVIAVATVAEAASAAPGGRSETIRVVRSQVHSSGPGPQPVGPWPFGVTREQDRAFYRFEDQRHAAWEEWKGFLLQEEELAKKRRSSSATDVGKSRGQPLVSSLAQTTRIINKDSFTDRQAARRRMELLRVITKNTSTLDYKLRTYKALTAKSFDLIQPPAIFPNASLRENNTLESQYVWFLENAFAHTVVPPVLRAGFSLIPDLHVLPPLMLMDNHVVDAMEKEVSGLRYNLKMLLVAPAKESAAKEPAEAAAAELERNSVIDEINLQINQMNQIVGDSKRALKTVQILATPLFERLLEFLEKSIAEKDQQVRLNDEATEAKRQEAKALTKAKGALLAIQHYAILASKDITKATYHDQLISAHTFVLGLAMIAKYRLGLPSGFSDLDALPAMAGTMPLVGVLQEELMEYIIWPFLVGAGISLVALLLIDEVWYFVVRRAIQSRDSLKKAVDRQELRKQMRWGFHMYWFMKAVLFAGLPLGYLMLTWSKGSLKWSEALAVALPAQRAAILFIGAVCYLVDLSVALLISMAHQSFRSAPRVIASHKKEVKEESRTVNRASRGMGWADLSYPTLFGNHLLLFKEKRKKKKDQKVTLSLKAPSMTFSASSHINLGVLVLRHTPFSCSNIYSLSCLNNSTRSTGERDRNHLG
eukprot:gene4922-3534_t